VLSSAGGALAVHWRTLWDGHEYVEVYQRAAYRLGSEGLVVRWGAPANTLADAATPTLGADEGCSTSGVSCYDHQEAQGF